MMMIKLKCKLGFYDRTKLSIESSMNIYGFCLDNVGFGYT